MTSGLVGRFVSHWPVWRIVTDRQAVEDGGVDEAGSWTKLDTAHVERLFADDHNRVAVFHRYLSTGQAGIALERNDEWLAYGWLATPTSGPPDHVPGSARGRYWIHYCRTSERHQGRGLYRQTIHRLLNEAEARAGAPSAVWIDTREDNAAARRGIERVGFEPDGVISLWRLPKASLRLSIWRRKHEHPR